MTRSFVIEPAQLADAPAIAKIYAHHVLYGTASFEIVPPDAAEIAARMNKVLDNNWPWLVARDAEGPDGGRSVLGYAYAAQYHARPGYLYSCEDSIYLRHDRLGEGIGTALLDALLVSSEACGFRQMVAAIAGTEPASQLLHAKAGFIEAGRLRSVGRKHDQWIDVLYMQKPLGAGDSTPV